ncbi:MAG TPA: protein kinase, partial [Polyangiaceae bacterium]
RLGHTRTGFVKGKIGYMAPEQARGSLVDRRCDVWAAGVIAWEVLSGQRLYPTADDDVATLLKVATQTPPRLRSVDPSIPAEVDEAVSVALDRNMDTRCPNALTFARRLSTACKAHGLLAETEEVSEWIALMAGARLASRREDLARAKERRASQPPPSAPGAEEQSAKTPAAVGGLTVREIPAPRKPIEPTMVMEHDHPLQLLKPIEEPTRTDTSSVVTHTPPKIPALRPRMLGTGAGVLALVLVALVVGRKTADAPVSPPAPASTAPIVATPASTTPAATTVATVTPPAGSDWTPIVPVEALPETPVASAVAPPTAPPHPHPGTRPRAHPAHARPVASSNSDGPAPLAPSPY